MVENRPILDLICHLILIAGVAIVVFPVYLAVIASTHGAFDFMSGLIPLLPGDKAIENYSTMLGAGISTSGTPPFLPTGKDVISLGAAPGPRIGQALATARQGWIAAGCPAGADEQIAFVRAALTATD